ncbi:hypothetical protein [Streptomyces sp. NPDC055709]
MEQLLAGADEVADRSFLGAGGQSAGPSPSRRTAPDGSAAPGHPASVPGAEPERESERPLSGSAWAHKAVHESFADAKLRSARWKSHGFRIAPDVLARLKGRVNADRRTTGNSNLAIGHYVDAALRHMPTEIDELITMAEEFEAQQLWDTERTQPSTYRVGEKAYAFMSGLKMMLHEAHYGRRGTQVASAGVEMFLDALDAQGPLGRPHARCH